MARRAAKFELWVADERGTLSKPSDKGDHSGFQLPHSVKGWALIGHKVIVLYRTDRSAPSPQQIRKYYTWRFPRYRVEDRYELSDSLSANRIAATVAAIRCT